MSSYPLRWLRRRPPEVDFDFRPRRAQVRLAAVLLWITALSFAAHVGWTYTQTRTALKELSEAPRVREPAPLVAERKPGDSKDLERELQFARSTINRMALPWTDLFNAVGACTVEGVTLLTIEPDANSGTVRFTAEAKDIPAMLTYVARLEANAFFPTVSLARHEVKRKEPRRPVAFVVVATWRNTR